MTARVWSEVIKKLDSLPWPEAKECAILVRQELNKFAPRLTRHSYPDMASKFHVLEMINKMSADVYTGEFKIDSAIDKCSVDIYDYSGSLIPEQYPNLSTDFMNKINRYSMVGIDICRTMVRYSWNNIAFAEMRDINRHRTGNRFSTFVPQGFYLPEEINRDERVDKFLLNYSELMTDISELNEEGILLYSSFMGTQFPFEHSTHLDKFIYEIELRTGMGAHFRYAEHYNNAYNLLIKKFPELKDYIVIGNAEPE